MEDERIRHYLEYLEKLGYTRVTIKLIQMRLGWFVKMFPDEKQWDNLHITNFLKIKQQMVKRRKIKVLKESYLHSLEGYIKRFFSYWGKEEFQKTKPVSTLSLWQKKLQGYLDYCSSHQGLAEATLAKRRYHLSRFITWLEKYDVAKPKALSSSTIIKFVSGQEQGYSLSKRKGFNAAMRGFLRYLYQHGAIACDLSCAITGPRSYREQRTPLYLTDFQIQTLLKTIDKKSSQGFRDYTIFILLIQYGLRTSEVAKLTVDDINWEDKTMLIKDRKNDPHLLLPLTEQVIRILKAYITLFRPPSQRSQLFLSTKAPIRPLKKKYFTQLTKKIFDKADIKGHAHLLRHSFAKRLTEQGQPLPVVQKLLGHKSIATTRIYAKLNIEQLREVAEYDSMERVKDDEKIPKD